MIPVRLSVRNFMCYREEGVVLELDNVRLACLSGENGSGKSALLGAITWALWGKARERVSDDELISQGASEMEVEYEFTLSDCRYRVVRKRLLKGASGTTILELHLLVDGAAVGSNGSGNGRATAPGTWRPLTGHNVRDTQAKITQLLKMEYDTFINSAFILQGRADEFTVKNPSDRKKVLADILGLDIYDLLEERAKEEAKDRKADILALDSQTTSIDRELSLRPEYAQNLEAVESDLIEKQRAQTDLKTELAELQARWQELRNNVRRLEELKEREGNRKQEMGSAKERLSQNNARKTNLEALLSQRDDIERGYADLQAALDEERRFSDSVATLLRLEMEKAGYEQEINGTKRELSSEVKQHERRISDWERNLAGRSVIERQLSETLEKLRKLEQLQAQHDDTRSLRETLDTRMQTLANEMVTLEKEGKQMREKLNMITGTHADGKDHAGCPLCGSDLTAEALGRVQRSYEEDIQARRLGYERKRNEQKAVNEEIAEVTSRLQKERDGLKDLPMYQQRKAEYDQKLRSLDENQKDLEREQSLLKLAKAQLDGGDYAREERLKLADVKSQMARIEYSEEAHSAAHERVTALQPYNERYHKLEGAETELASVRDNIEADNKRLAGWTKEDERDLAEITTLEPQVGKLDDLEDLMSNKRGAEMDLDELVGRLLGRQGELRGKIERCDALQQQKQHLNEKHKVATEEKAIYDELTTAFGKKGIQAMIIENIIPELEDGSNDLLHRMTDGRMSVQFITQRDAKTVKGSVIETLDINISDEMGTRAYELYSGGEAFRVNFAVRIALSKLLARRAGAQLQLLVIDEGFGTQDGQGRDKLVEAIRSIQDDFEKILVVTHIEELKGEFPVRIDVVKTPTGSLIVQDQWATASTEYRVPSTE